MKPKKKWKESSEKQKVEPISTAVNGPFVLHGIDGLARYGMCGQVVTAPLTVAIAGKDGQPPIDTKGQPVQVNVLWEVVKVPDGADSNLLPGDLSSLTVVANTRGRTQTSIRLGDILGIYTVRATLPDYPDCVDAFFVVYTEDVVSDIIILPTKPTSVDEAMHVVVQASDWRGHPVEDANLIAVVGKHAPPDSFAPVRRSRNEYVFEIRSRYAEKIVLIVGDVLTNYTVETDVEFLPGKTQELRFLPIENPRHHPPYNHMRLELQAFDQFGNLTRPNVVWNVSSGTIKPVPPPPGVSAAAFFTFTDEPKAVVTAQWEELSIDQILELPGVFLRPMDLEPFSYVGDNFCFRVEVFPPPGHGIAKAVNISLKQPIDSAKLVSTSHAHPESDVPMPQISEDKYDVLHIRIEQMESWLLDDEACLPITELEYQCIKPEEARFKVLDASIEIGYHSAEPNAADHRDQSRSLHPGTDYCRQQKEIRKKRLCLNFCLVTTPGGKTLKELTDEAKKQVKKAQEIFDANIPICCPQIKIKACYNELKWKDYKLIVNGGDKGGELEDGIWKENNKSTYNSDSKKDAWKLSQETKDLLKKCQKKNCHTVFIVPIFYWKPGVWTKGRGVNISPNDFPETTSAQDSGTGTIMISGETDDTVLVHELSHLLIDYPRNVNSGSEHVNDPDRVTYGGGETVPRNKFSKEECSYIWKNIDKYGGNCD